MKVCIVSPQGYTGLAYHDYGLCAGITQAGATCWLITSDDYILSHLLPAREGFQVLKLFRGISSSMGRRWKRGINYILSLTSVFYELRHSGAPLVHWQLPQLPMFDLFFFLILKRYGFVIVLTPHDILPLDYSVGWNRRIYETMYQLVDGVVVHGEHVLQYARTFVAIPEDKIFVIPHGNYDPFVTRIIPEKARRELGIPLDRHVVLFFGVIRKSKGLACLIEAFAKSRAVNPHLFLVIAGRPNRRENVEWYINEIKRYDIGHSAQLEIGFIPDDKRDRYFSSADVVVLPYTRIFSSGVIHLAYSYGVPVIASDLPTFQDIVVQGKTGFLFPSGNADALCERIVALFADQRQIQFIKEHALMEASKYSWERIGRTTIQMYYKLLERKAHELHK